MAAGRPRRATAGADRGRGARRARRACSAGAPATPRSSTPCRAAAGRDASRRRSTRGRRARSGRGSPAPTASRRSPAPSGSATTSPHDGALDLRAVRSPHAHARFTRRRPRRRSSPAIPDWSGSSRPPTSPAQNRYGIYATGKDQPVLADGDVRYQRRGGAGARRRRGDGRRDRRRRAADHVGAAPAADRHRRRAGPGRAAAPRGLARATSSSRGSCGWATSTAALAGVRRHRRPGRSRRPTSSTPTSSPRPGRPAWSTAGSRSSRRPRRRTWTATSSP